MSDLVEIYDLGDHPEHAKLVGQIAAIWSGIEYRLCHLFAWMKRCPPWHAQSAFFQLVNNKARIDMIRGLQQHLKTDAERQAISNTLERLPNIAGIRNRYCHARWQKKGKSAYITTSVGSIWPHGNRQLVTLKTLRSELGKMQRFDANLVETIKTLTSSRPLSILKDDIHPALRDKLP